jgi:polar amino acid transport system substrate-binding protein
MRYPLVTLLLLMMSFPSMAQSLRVAVGSSLSPYVIEENNTGAELDIVREALALRGHDITPEYAPYGRVNGLLQQARVDAALTLPSEGEEEDIFFSDEYITYHNVVLALAFEGFAIHTLDDMVNYRVLAFQNAARLLGPEFGHMASNNIHYSETTRQHSQVDMLFSERIDLIVMDRYIFNYYRAQAGRESTERPVSVFELFPPVSYRIGFRDPALRDDFNAGLQQLRQSGRYQAILDQYLQ